MKCEITIRGILGSNLSVDSKADSIGKFMSWDRDELIEAIKEYGCNTQEAKSKVIGHFWGKLKK